MTAADPALRPFTVGELDRLAAAAGRLVTWLVHVEQPAGAACSHLGAGIALGRKLWLRAAPSGFARASGRAVVIAESRHVSPLAGRAYRPLLEHHCDAIAAALEAAGATIADRWNGAETETGSWALADPTHPSLLAAVENRLNDAGDPGLLIQP